jgi:hypothetical protein
MLTMLGEVLVDVRKVFELEARRPLLSPASSPMQGRKAEGCAVADGDEKQGEGGKGEEDDSESQAEYGGGSRGLSAGCARLWGRLDCGTQEKPKTPLTKSL